MPLLRVALTGGIATGKSHCLRTFAALGVPVIDADVLAHEAMSPDSAAGLAVVARFGPGVLATDGRIDRLALGRIVFADTAARHDLEAIIHPLVYARIRSWLEKLAEQHATAGAAATHPLVAIADIPLLYETGHAADFDRVVVVACDPQIQLGRLLARGGLTEGEARLRIASQMPLEEKIARADYVLRTSGSTTDTDLQVTRTLEQLRG
jgi:dephospho-CoA kinase